MTDGKSVSVVLGEEFLMKPKWFPTDGKRGEEDGPVVSSLNYDMMASLDPDLRYLFIATRNN